MDGHIGLNITVHLSNRLPFLITNNYEFFHLLTSKEGIRKYVILPVITECFGPKVSEV